MLTIEDLWGTIEVIVFSKVFAATEDILTPEEYDDPVFINGYLNRNDDTVKVIAQNITPLAKIRMERSSNVQIQLPSDFDINRIDSIKDIMLDHPGNCAVSLSLTSENHCKVLLQLAEKVAANDEFVGDLEELLPLENIEFQYARETVSDL